MDLLIKGSNKEVWIRSLSNEWGRLAQGNDYRTKRIDIIDFIFKYEVPEDKAVTHASFVCGDRRLKQETYRIRIIVGGDRLPYEEDTESPAVNLLETKILLNSTISDVDKSTRFISADIKDHFLATPMKNPEYIKVKYQHIPIDIK